MKRLAIIFSTALALCACTPEQQPVPPVPGEALEPEYTWGTRADVPHVPVHGNAYTIVSYLGTSTISSTGMKSYGYYAYNAVDELGVGSGFRGAAGTMVPVAPVFPTYSLQAQPAGWYTVTGLPDFAKSTGNAQHLIPGAYRTAMLYPAIPFRTIGSDRGLGAGLAAMERGDKVYASYIDDANGDGTKGDEFTMTVSTNRQVNEIPAGLNLFPIEASVRFYFYSARWDGSSPTFTENDTFTITSLTLNDIGSNGWYSAARDIIYPNYNYRKTANTADYRTSYSSTDIFDANPANNLPVAIDLLDPSDPTATPDYIDYTSAAPADKVRMPYGPGTSGAAPVYFPTDVYAKYSTEVAVFPSDYSGAEPLVKALKLNAVLDMGSGLTNTVNSPIAIRIERGRRYNFYINSTSEAVIISYSIESLPGSVWDLNDMGSGTIGEEPVTHLTTILLGNNPWNPGDMGGDEIGN